MKEIHEEGNTIYRLNLASFGDQRKLFWEVRITEEQIAPYKPRNSWKEDNAVRALLRHQKVTQIQHI